MNFVELKDFANEAMENGNIKNAINATVNRYGFDDLESYFNSINIVSMSEAMETITEKIHSTVNSDQEIEKLHHLIDELDIVRNSEAQFFYKSDDYDFENIKDFELKEAIEYLENNKKKGV